MLTIDDNRGVVIVDDEQGRREFDLDTPEGFAAVSDAWLRAGWGVKHVYTFTWMGRPVIQLPEDSCRTTQRSRRSPNCWSDSSGAQRIRA